MKLQISDKPVKTTFLNTGYCELGIWVNDMENVDIRVRSKDAQKIANAIMIKLNHYDRLKKAYHLLKTKTN